MVCSGRAHAILCSPEGSEVTSTSAKTCWLEARAFACSGGLRVLCALCSVLSLRGVLWKDASAERRQTFQGHFNNCMAVQHRWTTGRCLDSSCMTWISVWAPTWPHAIASLQALEDRFAALIEPTLAAAMTQRNRERVQKLAAMLVGMGRPEAVERLYNTARLAPLQVGLPAAGSSC